MSSSIMGVDTEAGQEVANVMTLLEALGTEALVEAEMVTAATADDDVVEADEAVVVEEEVKEEAEELRDVELVRGADDC